MALDRSLQAWSRIDGNGRLVPGSTVLRKQKPKVGTWELNKTYQCCNTVTLSYTVINTSIDPLAFQILCGSTSVYLKYTGQSVSNAGEIVVVLNNYVASQFPAIGSFTTANDEATTNAVIEFTISTDLANIFCPYRNGLSFSVFAD